MAEPQNSNQNGAWSRYLTDRESIRQVFVDFRDRKDPVTLRFEGVETAYVTCVVDVDARHVRLGELRPRSGNMLMSTRRPFALSGRSEGVYVYSPQNVSHGMSADTLGSHFLVSLPESLLWQQRRRAVRFQLPAVLAAGRARVSFDRAGHCLVGRIENISTGGCRASFEGAASPALVRDAVIDELAVEVGGLLSIRTRAAIRYVTVDRERGSVTCGIEFTRMAGGHQRRLEQFVRSLARIAAQA
jgi:c-di-GMP-binding flagellar brake protein YcgR